MPKTRSQKRAASHVESSPAQPVPAKRARQRSSNAIVEVPTILPNVMVKQDLSQSRKGKQPERPSAIPFAPRPKDNSDRCHVYLAGPEDFRSGLDEQENERLEVAAEDLLVQGKKLAAVEMQDLRWRAGLERAGSRNEVEDLPWTGNYWKVIEMKEFDTINYLTDARTWRYSAPPLPTALDLEVTECKVMERKMVSNTVGIPEWRRTSAAESFQLYRPNNVSTSPPQENDSHDLLETPFRQISAPDQGPTILLSPLSLRGPVQPGGSSRLRSQPPDLEWLDPELDNLPDFEWGWDKGLGKEQSDTQRESLTIWRQSLSGSHERRSGQATSVLATEPLPDPSTTGMISCLTDPSIVEETATQAGQESEKVENLDPRYQRLPLRLAPFEIPVAHLPGSSVPAAKEALVPATKSRKKVVKQNPLETLKDVKPMKQELSPFILRSSRQERGVPKSDAQSQGIETAALVTGISVLMPNERMAETSGCRLPDTGVVLHEEDDGNIRDSPEAMCFQIRPVLEPVRTETLKWMKHHRKWTRQLISRDRRFGQYTDMVPEPFNLHVPEDGPAYTQVANQAIGAPIKMPSIPHPFHPDLAALLKAQPKLRVRWTIPIHGPVVLMTEQEIQNKFWPSPAIITTDALDKNFHGQDDMITSETRRRNRRDVLMWSSSAMTKFWKETAKLQARGTCGPISISVSGPHPDPFRAVSTPWTLASHRMTTRPDDSSFQPPIRAFAGDHLRIGCDLEHALIFRMWLGTRSFGFPATTTDIGKQRLGENPFLRIKLCLLGPLGEVLAVI